MVTNSHKLIGIKSIQKRTQQPSYKVGNKAVKHNIISVRCQTHT
jgi:hypothetical protein